MAITEHPVEAGAAITDHASSRLPFSVVTSKRLYSNMLIESLGVEINPATENVLMVTATCRSIIIVQTRSVRVPPQSQQANPASTAGGDRGAVYLVPVQPSTALAAQFGGLY